LSNSFHYVFIQKTQHNTTQHNISLQFPCVGVGEEWMVVFDKFAYE